MNLLFSITENYTKQLRTTLFSIRANNPQDAFDVYLILDGHLSKQVDGLSDFCRSLNMKLHLIQIPEKLFAKAPKTKRYPKTIYYRLIAQNFLPDSLNRILYLDCDLICLNPFGAFYHLDFENKLYAAASHFENIKISSTFNKIRLGNYDSDNYFNSGVLLMNLKMLRQTVNINDIYAYIKKNSLQLLLPDQDVLNALYGNQIKSVADTYYNYDTRYFSAYKLLNDGLTDLDWITKHTVFLHFCGPYKPWNKSYNRKFAALYKHYEWIANRDSLDKNETNQSLKPSVDKKQPL
ncbi:hypothetical protein OAL24_00088 [Oenococcus sicerae]|nr:hypothetical protein OAL24_00088 [Oenococcus sicerae]